LKGLELRKHRFYRFTTLVSARGEGRSSGRETSWPFRALSRLSETRTAIESSANNSSQALELFSSHWSREPSRTTRFFSLGGNIACLAHCWVRSAPVGERALAQSAPNRPEIGPGTNLASSVKGVSGVLHCPPYRTANPAGLSWREPRSHGQIDVLLTKRESRVKASSCAAGVAEASRNSIPVG